MARADSQALISLVDDNRGAASVVDAGKHGYLAAGAGDQSVETIAQAAPDVSWSFEPYVLNDRRLSPTRFGAHIEPELNWTDVDKIVANGRIRTGTDVLKALALLNRSCAEREPWAPAR